MKYTMWLKDAVLAQAKREGIPEDKALKDFDQYLIDLYDRAYDQGHSDGEVGLML